MAVILALASRPVSAAGKIVRVGACAISVPDDWAVTGAQVQSPDGKIGVSLDEVVDGAVTASMEEAMGGISVASNSTRKIVAMRAPNNSARYLAVAPPSGQACRARIEATDAVAVGKAESVAGSLKRIETPGK